MSGTVTSMSMIKQVLQLHKSGSSNRSIALELGLDKETVNSYVRTITTNNYDIEALLKLEDPVLEGKFKAGSAAYTDKRFDDLKELLPHMEQEMKRKHVTRNLLWQEYLSSHPDGYRYTQFCFHLNQLLIARKPVAHLEHNPGEKLYVDFTGDTVEFVNSETGEVYKAQVFVATLPYSDYTFAMAVESQSTADFLYALSRCLAFLGGSPKIVVPDNLKAAVIKADKYEPELNRLMADFANHYGFVVLAARPGRPRDKSSVENAVKIIYNRVYAHLRNRTFFSIEELNVAFGEKVRDHNQTRMQQRNHSREELFIAEEKPALTPLPLTEYEVKYYIDLRVAANNYIYLGRDNHYYSVPYTYIGQKVSVIYTRTLVQVYFKNQSIAVHQRVVGYGYTTIKEHLCSSHQHYMERSAEYYIEKAKRCSAELEHLFRRIFEQTQLPETMYKRCDGLLNLYRKTELKAFECACRMALDHGQLTCKFVQRVIEKKTYKLYETSEGETGETPLPKHENIRGREYYTCNLFE
ncbi:MAG: IS21 family transposase [Oscillospiraceae bacterium]|jgi:transposase|nr:IS21 family transposase [Oscillospiraceae bacterium]